MSKHTPPLYALVPITETEGLESREYIVVNKNGFPFLTKYKTTDPDGWVELDKPSNFKHYLRPLPEGTKILKPGEVAVSEEELLKFGNDILAYCSGFDAVPEIVTRFIQTKLAQMGE